MTCPECKYEPRTVELPFPSVVVPMPGTPHHTWCPTVPRLSPEAWERVQAKIDDVERARRRAMAEMHTYVIGGQS